MNIDTVTQSISAMKLTEARRNYHREIRLVLEQVKFDIENIKELLRTPEDDKGVNHYYFETIQARLLREKIHQLKVYERKTKCGSHCRRAEFVDLKRDAVVWWKMLTKESIYLEKELAVTRQTLYHGRPIKVKRLIPQRKDSPRDILRLKEYLKEIKSKK